MENHPNPAGKPKHQPAKDLVSEEVETVTHHNYILSSLDNSDEELYFLAYQTNQIIAHKDIDIISEDLFDDEDV